MQKDLIEKITELNEADEYSKCIELIEAIPEAERGYALTVLLGRAYSNLGLLGDHKKEEETDNVDIFLMEKAVKTFESVRLEGMDDWYWHSRMAYALWMMSGRELEALAHARKWQELNQDDEDAAELIKTIEEFVEETYKEPIVYDFKEMETVGKHIEEYFGKYDNVMYELMSPDIHIDICVISPRAEHEYYTLVTMGMGAAKMPVPEDYDDLARAELLINLPADWQLDKESLKDEKWYWPIRLLKFMARAPLGGDVYHAWGSTMEFDDIESFDDNTRLCTAITLSPGVFGEPSFECKLPNGELVNFYQVIPLYKEELDYKVENGVDKLLQKCPDEILEVINPVRLNAITDAETLNYDDREMDSADEHIELIHEHNLPVEEIAAYNHMAAYLRWCMEQNLMGDVFMQQHGDEVHAVQNGNVTDLRAFVRDALGGRLMITDYNCGGVCFANWYNTGNRSMPYAYIKDLKAYAQEYFKENETAAPEVLYLLLPWDDEYYRTASDIIAKRFAEWRSLDDNVRLLDIPAVDEMQFKQLLADWQSARHCRVSKRIAKDGCAPAFCCREEPDRDDTGWDSGWYFEAGDEAEVYPEADAEYAIYDLNIICNLCPDILPLLNLPYGSAFERDDNGKWQQLEPVDGEE